MASRQRRPLPVIPVPEPPAPRITASNRIALRRLVAGETILYIPSNNEQKRLVDRGLATVRGTDADDWRTRTMQITDKGRAAVQ